MTLKGLGDPISSSSSRIVNSGKGLTEMDESTTFRGVRKDHVDMDDTKEDPQTRFVGKEETLVSYSQS